MNEIFLPDRELSGLFDALDAQYEVIVFSEDGVVGLADLPSADRIGSLLHAPRSPFPAKSYLLPARETVAHYVTIEGADMDGGQADPVKPPALVNLRSCDVEAIRVLDRIFQDGDFVDPFYRERRAHLMVVSVDCADITEHCFCQLVGGEPVVREGMGINLTPLEGGYLARADTPKGEAILGALAGMGEAAGAAHQEQAAQRHQATLALLKESNEKFGPNGDFYAEVLKAEVPPDKWNDLFATCVECGSCTNVCPTCYCFYMVDRAAPGEKPAVFEKLRSWDSCLLSDYSRMAGGDGMRPTPRPRLRTRYENRFRHKFEYYQETYGQYACTGCGRCQVGCSATADPREVMRVLAQ